MTNAPIQEVLDLLAKLQAYGGGSASWAFNDNFVDIHLHIPAWYAMTLKRLETPVP